VLSLEDDAWFSPDRVATLADTYVNNRPVYTVPRTTAAKVASTATNVGTNFPPFKDHKTRRTVTITKVVMEVNLWLNNAIVVSQPNI